MSVNSQAGMTQQEIRDKYFDRGRGADLRKKPNKTRRYEVETLWEVHHEIARRLLLGEKNVDIARDLNINPVTVSAVRNSQVVREKLDLMIGARDASTVDISRQIKEYAPKALELLRNVIEGQTDLNASIGLRTKTAERWLDKAGYGPVQRTASLSLEGRIDSDDMKAIKERAHELAELNGVIDI